MGDGARTRTRGRRGSLALAAALAAALALGLAVAVALAAGARAGRYSGSTSEHSAVTLTIRGGKITHFHAEIGYNGKCGQGGGPVLTASPATISLHGSHFSLHLRLHLRNVVNDPGVVEGTASGSHVSGKIVQLLNGQPNRCYTETFSARRFAA